MGLKSPVCTDMGCARTSMCVTALFCYQGLQAAVLLAGYVGMLCCYPLLPPRAPTAAPWLCAAPALPVAAAVALEASKRCTAFVSLQVKKGGRGDKRAYLDSIRHFCQGIELVPSKVPGEVHPGLSPDRRS